MKPELPEPIPSINNLVGIGLLVLQGKIKLVQVRAGVRSVFLLIAFSQLLVLELF